MHTVPEQLAALAGVCLDTSKEIDAAWTAAVAAMDLVAGAAGNTPGGAALVASHGTTGEAAELVFSRFAGVLEQDMDDLYKVAFDMSTTDETVASDYRVDAGGPGGGPHGPRVH